MELGNEPLQSSPSRSLLRRALVVPLLSSFAFLFLVFSSSEPFKSLLLWLSISLLLGPFAPPSLTAGDIRVGRGPPLTTLSETHTVVHHEKPTRKSVKKSSSSHTDSPPVNPQHIQLLGLQHQPSELGGSLTNSTQDVSHGPKFEEIEWNEADDELLKRLMAKHPVGKPGRWEDIARGFNGRFQLETVIAKAKNMVPTDEDSYSKFLRQRRPVDKRVLEQAIDAVGSTPADHGKEETNKGHGWSATDDLALLNALKAFPKDAPLRWEKIAASVPGKTKPECLKRVSELKKNFRSSRGLSTLA